MPLLSLTGTLNMAALHHKIPLVANRGLLTALAVLFLTAFGIKAAIFPLFFWLPAAYHTPPVSVSAIFAGLLTKVGIYALIRFFTLVFAIDMAYLYFLLPAVAALTMITGVLGAAAQNEFRRILSFHIISQVGYMVLGAVSSSNSRGHLSWPSLAVFIAATDGLRRYFSSRPFPWQAFRRCPGFGPK